MPEIIVAWRRRDDWPKWQELQKTRQNYEDYLSWIGKFVDLHIWEGGNYPKMVTVRPVSPFLEWHASHPRPIDQMMLDEYAALITRG